jgi:kinesin family protein 2/24
MDAHLADFEKLSSTTPLKSPTKTIKENPTFTAALRVRPIIPYDETLSQQPFVQTTPQAAYVHKPRFNARRKPIVETKAFQGHCHFDQETPTEDIYTRCIVPLLQLAKEGGSGAAIVFGQTGSGKTFTMQAILALLSAELLSPDMRVSLSVFELFNKADVYDLLEDQKRIQLLENRFGSIDYSGLSAHTITSQQEFDALVERAASLRRTAATFKNETSSRSHCFYRIQLVHVSGDRKLNGELLFVDLAGSEHTSDKRKHSAERLAEAKHINHSLMTLKDCVRNRSNYNPKRPKATHIPFRHALLTRCLKPVLNTKAKKTAHTVLIGCLSPLMEDVEQSLNTASYVVSLATSPPIRKFTEIELANDPLEWTNEQFIEWTRKYGTFNSLFMCPEDEDGHAMAQLSEHDFCKRTMDSLPCCGPERARKIYLDYFKLQIDSAKKQQ